MLTDFMDHHGLAGQPLLTIDHHGAGATNGAAAGVAKSQCCIQLIPDLKQGIQNGVPTPPYIQAVILLIRVSVPLRIELLDSHQNAHRVTSFIR